MDNFIAHSCVHFTPKLDLLSIPGFRNNLKSFSWHFENLESGQSKDNFSPETLNTGLVSSGASLTSLEEVVSLALVGNPSTDGVTVIKILYGVDVLHRPNSHCIFFYWVG